MRRTTRPFRLFERFLTVWVGLGILAGVGFVLWVPAVFAAVSALELAYVSLVVAVFIWVMIPIEVASIRNLGQRPRRLVLTPVINWLVKPVTRVLPSNGIDMEESTPKIQTRLSMLNLAARTNHPMETP